MIVTHCKDITESDIFFSYFREKNHANESDTLPLVISTI
jgi:hypothetical protein